MTTPAPTSTSGIKLPSSPEELGWIGIPAGSIVPNVSMLARAFPHPVYTPPAQLMGSVAIPGMIRQPVPGVKVKTPTEATIEYIMKESCILRGAISTVMGFGLGAMFGTLFGGYDFMMPQGKSTWEQTKWMARQWGKASKASGKGFAKVGAIFATSECYIESKRGVVDIYNPIYAGCFSGAVLAYSGGPTAMAFGCVGFAAFSGAIDYYMFFKDDPLTWDMEKGHMEHLERLSHIEPLKTANEHLFQHGKLLEDRANGKEENTEKNIEGGEVGTADVPPPELPDPDVSVQPAEASPTQNYAS